MQAPLVLASSSKYRQGQLARLQLAFTAEAHRADEAELPGLPISEVPGHLAVRKAESLRAIHPRALIIGSDQLVAIDGVMLGKPGDRAGARGQLEQLAGRTHELITAVALSGPDGQLFGPRTVVHQMTMRALDAAEIERYLDVDEPYDCCGSYKIESRGIALFCAVEGEDPSAIEGLPLIALSELLRSAGVRLP